MTFAQRQINLQFSDADGIVSLEGLRCAAMIANFGGGNGFGNLELRVFGMTLSQMNRFTGVGSRGVALNSLNVKLFAGDVGSPIQQVFDGSVTSCYPDFSNAPDVLLSVSAVVGYDKKGTPGKAINYAGANNAEDIIAALAKAAGFQFSNKNSAHAVLRDQNLYGSLVDQMQKVANAAAFPLVIENGTVTIWPNDGVRDDVVIAVGPQTGMVGYPSYWDAGLIVKTEFNPLLANGRQVDLTSTIPKANGRWPIRTVTHELSTLTPDGPWYSTATLASGPFVAKN